MNKKFDRTQSENYLKRERLYRMLTPEEDTQLITVVAESGYGKTRAVLDYLAEEEAAVVWLPLTFYDNYPSHFWENFVNSFKTVDKHLGNQIEDLEFPSNAQILQQFAHILLSCTRSAESLVMVFDDFQVIDNERVRNFVENLVYMEMDNVVYYVISRSEVHMQKWKVQGSVRQIREDDLAFTLDEVEAYFKQKRINIGYDILTMIHKNTQGWPSAVYLASLAAQNNSSEIKSLVPFSDTLLFEVIEQEIFSKYSKGEQSFLLRLSLFDFYPMRMMQEIFPEEIKAYTDSMAKNVFIRYIRHTKSFQFHQLFRDFLKSRQKYLSVEEKEYTYRRVGAWFENLDLAVDALNCYGKIYDYEASWRIIWKLFPEYFSSEFAQMILDIMEGFPDEFREQHPHVYTAMSALYNTLGKLDEGLDFAWRIIREREYDDTYRHIVGELYISIAFTHMLRGRADFCDYFVRAEKYLPQGSVLYQKPFMLLLNGDVLIFDKGEAKELENWIEAYKKAEPYYTRLLHGNMYGTEVLAEAKGCYYQGDMKKAEKYAVQAVYRGKSGHQTDIVCQAYYLLARIRMYKGEYAALLDALEHTRSYAREQKAATQFYIPDVAEGWFFAKIGLDQEIPDWIIHEKTYSMKQLSNFLGFESLIRAASLLNQEEYYELLAYLKQLEDGFCKMNKYPYLIHVHILYTIVYYYSKDMEKAIHEFWISYQMTHKNNLIMYYAEYGRHTRTMAEGLRNLKNKETLSSRALEELQGIPEEWISQVVAKSSTLAKRAAAIREQYLAGHPEKNGGQKILTKREIDVLKGLCEGLTKDEIADSMGVTYHTIKSVTNSIYTKLGAINATHAVRIAMLRGYI